MTYFTGECEYCDNRSSVLLDIELEKIRQYAMWGEQNHSPVVYFAILAEEFGEVAKEVVELNFNTSKKSLENLRNELIQTAAVAIAMVECLDRNKTDEQ